MALVVTDPIQIVPNDLIATDIPENDHAAYSADETYALSDRVVHDHAIYESAVDDNHGNTPHQSPVQWLYVSPTNRWRAFDLRSLSWTTGAPGGFYVEFRPSKPITALHLVHFINVGIVRVYVRDANDALIFDSGRIAVGRVVPEASYWQFFFGARGEVDLKNFYDIPYVPLQKIRIEFEGGDKCAIGAIVCGTTTAIGGVQYGLKYGILDNSRIQKNDFGDVVLQRRAYSSEMSLTATIDNKAADGIKKFLVRRRAKPLYWNASNRWESTQVLGFYRDWSVLINYYASQDVSITIEGMRED